jgi:hypothetical protein
MPQLVRAFVEVHSFCPTRIIFRNTRRARLFRHWMTWRAIGSAISGGPVWESHDPVRRQSFGRHSRESGNPGEAACRRPPVQAKGRLCTPAFAGATVRYRHGSLHFRSDT